MLLQKTEPQNFLFGDFYANFNILSGGSGPRPSRPQIGKNPKLWVKYLELGVELAKISQDQKCSTN